MFKKCGADCVKFQKSCINEKFTSLARNRLYNSKNSFGTTYGEHKHFLEFTEEQYKELRRYAVKKVGIHFTASAMDPVNQLQQFNSIYLYCITIFYFLIVSTLKFLQLILLLLKLYFKCLMALYVVQIQINTYYST